MWCTVDIVEILKPKYVLWENVKNLLSKKHIHNFNAYVEIMDKLGYNSYFEVLNAKDFGIPQNRERVYTISIRKDIDNNNFKFPEKQELKIRLKDVLEDSVDEKYYLSDKMIQGFQKHNINHNDKGTGFIWKTRNTDGIASTLRANSALAPTDNTINVGEVTKNSQAGQVYSIEGISPTLTAGTHGYSSGNILQNKCIQVGDLSGGKWDKINESCRRVYSEDGISPTIHTCQGGNTEPKVIVTENNTIDNPLKGISNYGWHFEQNVYSENSLCCRSVKAGGGSGNIPKIITSSPNDNKTLSNNLPQSQNFIERKYHHFINKNGYIPYMFNPYHEKEIKNIVPTLTSNCGITTSSSTVLKAEKLQLSGAYGRNFGSRGKLQNQNTICDTLVAAMGTGGGNVPIIEEIPKIITHNILPKVYIRKYAVDIEKLKRVLRNSKIDSNINNEWLRTQLDVPITTIEHWFRKDDNFSIPSPEIWFKLKDLLHINTNEFDESIMMFIEKDNIYEKSNRIYDENGIAPTVKENHGTVTAVARNTIDIPYIVASRGRKVANEKNKYEQALEKNSQGLCNSLTSVQKDNLVVVINKNAKHQQDLVQSKDDICRTIPAGTHGSTPHLLKH